MTAGIKANSDGSGAIQVGGSDAINITTGLNVGIGTSTPATILDVNGTITSRSVGGGEGGQLNLLNPDNASTGFTVDVASADVGRVFSVRNNSLLQMGQLVGTGGTVTFHTAAQERMRIGESGQIGIGGANYGTSGQVLTSQGASSAPVWSNASGMTLLGTLTTTSGTTQTLSGLTLTGYTALRIVINNVSHSNATTGSALRLNTVNIQDSTTSNTISLWAIVDVDLTIGTFGSSAGSQTSTTGATGSPTSRAVAGNVQVFTSTTSLAFSWATTSTFDAGTITVYGVK